MKELNKRYYQTMIFDAVKTSFYFLVVFSSIQVIRFGFNIDTISQKIDITGVLITLVLGIVSTIWKSPKRKVIQFNAQLLDKVDIEKYIFKTFSVTEKKYLNGIVLYFSNSNKIQLEVFFGKEFISVVSTSENLAVLEVWLGKKI